MVETIKDFQINQIKHNDYSGLKLNLDPEIEDLIQTIVFDLGGVYFTAGTLLAIEKIKKVFHIKDTKKIHQIFRDKPYSEGYLIRRGLISIQEFERRTALKLNIPLNKKHHIRQMWFSSYVPNYKMEEIIKELSCNYKLIIFSGNIEERIQYLDEKYDFLKYFDDFLFSFEFKMNKKEMNFYKELIKHIDCNPSNALLIDDNKRVLEHGVLLGFNGIQYSYTEKFLRDLQTYGIHLNLD